MRALRACVGLHDKVEPPTHANILYRLGELLVVLVERKCHRGTVRIKRGVGAYVVFSKTLTVRGARRVRIQVSGG